LLIIKEILENYCKSVQINENYIFPLISGQLEFENKTFYIYRIN